MKAHIGVDAESGLVRTVNAPMMLRRRKRSCVATRNWVSAAPGIRGPCCASNRLTGSIGVRPSGDGLSSVDRK